MSSSGEDGDSLEEESHEQQFHSDSNDDREINREHLLNYESDDSDEEDEDEFDNGLAKQKEDLVMNDTWGSKKRNFYGRDKKADDESASEDDEDEFQEALRLQKVRARKLQLQQ